MFSVIVRYGLAAGLIVGVPMIWRMLAAEPGDENPLDGMLAGYLVMILALTAIFVGVKTYRDKALGGAIRFMPAFAVGLGISAVAGILYVIAWEISIAFSSFDFSAFWRESMIEGAKAKGASPEELQKTIADADAFLVSYRNPLYRMPMTFVEIFPVGVLVSLISAAVLRNSRVLPARARS